jgi:hypothetical protein
MLRTLMPSASKEASMRQAMLILAIAVGSPLAMAQSATGTVTPAAAPQRLTAVAANASPARRPLSPIGRALADLLGAANQQRAQAQAGANANAGIDADAASRARLAAETEHDSVP